MCVAPDNNPNSDLYFRIHLLSLCNWIFCKWKPVVGEGSVFCFSVSLPTPVWWTLFLTPCRRGSEKSVTWLASVWCWFVLLVRMVKLILSFGCSPPPSSVSPHYLSQVTYNASWSPCALVAHFQACSAEVSLPPHRVFLDGERSWIVSCRLPQRYVETLTSITSKYGLIWK